MSTTKLSPNFTLQEATASSTATRHGVQNNPTMAELEMLRYAAAKMEIVREVLDNRPIYISSWFRSHKVNQLVGGSKTSAHLSGLAVDFTARGYGTLERTCAAIIAAKDIIQYDQLILEPTWIHLGFSAPDKTPRMEELTYTGKQYLKGIKLP